MQIRDYTEDDRSELLALTLRCWEPVFAAMEAHMNPAIYKPLVPDWQAEQRRSLDNVCDDDGVEVIVAVIEDAIAGFAAIKSHPEDFLGEIYMIGVDPSQQRKGVGRALIDAGLSIIKRNGFKLAMVETGGDPAHEPARAAYEAAGFELWPVARYFKPLE